MLTLIVTEKGGTPKRMEFDRDEVTVGRVPGNDIVLPKGNVSKRHSRVVRQEGRFFVVDLKSTNGTYLNGRRITTPSQIRPGDKIYIGDFVVMIDTGDQNAMDAAAAFDDAPPESGPADDHDAVAAAFGPPDDEEPAPPPGFGAPRGGPAPMGAPARPGSPAPMGGPPPMGSPGSMGGPPPMGGPGSMGPPGPMGGPPPMRGAPTMGPGGPAAAGPAPRVGPGGPPGMGGPPSMGAPPGPPRSTLNTGGAPPPMGGPQSAPPPPMGTPPAPMGGPALGGPPPLRASQPGPAPAPMAGPPGFGGSGPRPLGAPPPRDPSPDQGMPAAGPGPMGLGGPPPMAPLAPASLGPAPSLGGPPPSLGGPPPSLGGPPPSLGGPPPSLGGPPPSLGGPPPSLGGPPPSLGGPGLVAAPLASPEPMGAPMPMESHREVMPAMDDEGGEFGNEQATPVPFPSPAAPPPPQSPLAPAPLGATAIPQAPSPLAAPVLAAPSLGGPSAAAPQRPMARALEPVVGNEYQDALGQVVRTAQQRGVEGSVGDEVARARLRPALEQIARGLGPMPAGVTTEKLTRDALAEIAGTGALETVLEEAEVSAVVIDGAGAVHAARSSPLAPTGQWFSSPEAAAQCLDRWLQAQGIQRHGQPVVQAVTADGIRVTAAFAPVAARGVVASLERPIPRAASLQELSTHNVLSSPAVALLSTALAARRNVVVVGAQGAGRTTLLAALLAELPAGDRVVVVEARDELSRARRSAASLRVHNGDWSAPVSLALQLRTGRVVFGDCNAAVAQAFVGRLTTGVEGMLVGVEAPSAQAGIARLAAEATRDGWFDKADALARLGHTRPLVVEVSRGGDGALRVSSLGEARPEGAGVRVEPLFTLRVDGADAQGGLTTQLIPTGASPSF